MGSFPHKHLSELLLFKNTGMKSVTIVAEKQRIPNVTVYLYPDGVPSIAVESGAYVDAYARYGFECHHDGKWTCSLCPQGTYSRGDGASMGCWECPAGGFYQDSVAAVGVTGHGNGCKRCPEGTFVHPRDGPGKAIWECKACPEGTNTTTFADFRACWCLKYYYRLDRFGSCAVCSGQGVECSHDKLNLSRGFYWKWTDGNLTSYKLLMENLATESDRYDNKTMKFVGKLPKAYKCLREDSCLGGIDSQCAQGYAGPLCANCQSGYYKRVISCHKCPTKKLIGIQFGVLALSILVIILVIIKCSKSSKAGERTTADIFLAHMKIAIGFYQVLAGLLQAFSYIKWPSKVALLDEYIKFIQINILQIVSPSCINEELEINAYSNFAFTLAGNVLIVVVPTIFYLMRMIWVKMKEKQDDENEANNSKKIHLKIAMFLLFIAYPATCVSVFQILPISCHELCPFEGASNCPSFLRADYSITCDTEKHQKYAWAAYVSLSYVIGFPIYLTYIVWKYHLKARKSPRKYSLQDESSNLSSMAFALLFLHENYSPSCWYWESIEMVRKVVLSAGVIFVGSESRTQVGIAAMVSVTFAMLHARFKPITDRFEDWLQMMSLLVTSFNLSVGVLLKMPSDEVPGSVDASRDNEGLGILLLITNGLVISVLIARYLIAVAQLALDCRKNRRWSWSCICLFLTTAQDFQADVTNTSLQKTPNA